ncbi:MAG: heme lyase CcmF/NrfE family subunit [Alphaproteobacteria bacterium]|nr:heme lyase CcmF/NrfE family subunit [Alphaproteobacteria bacterium]
MIGEAGAFLSILALVLVAAQGVLGLLGHARPGLAAAAAACAQAALACLALAFAALVSLFLSSDFSFAVVANNSHTAKPLIYKFAGTWGNHEGSMLLWCLVSALFGALLTWFRGGLSHGLWSRAVGVQGLVTLGALVYTLALSSPFARLDPVPYQGGDLNPLLQDPALALHPPLLYLGYVGLSAPFSLALAALMEGETNTAWAKALRPWTLVAWSSLTGGIALGSYWAYYELGWGGWWFWDPVENASFMPWLAACALLHSTIVTERRGSLASWTILLAIIGFALALLGTFLVRSGALTSVHAFAVDPARGTAVLVLFSLAVGIGLTLFAWRAPTLMRPAGFAAVSRESFLVLNNLGLAIAAGTVLIGTLYPLLIEAVTGELISVGPPFFDISFSPLMAALLLAMPIAPLMAWRKGALSAALRWTWPAGLAAGAAVGLGLFAVGGGFWVGLGLGVGVWCLLGALAYVWKRWGQGGPRTFARFLALPLAVWAMTAAHAGVGVFTLGAVIDTAFKLERAERLHPGDSIDFAGRSVRLVEVVEAEGPNYIATRARLEVSYQGTTALAAPERRFYPGANQPTTEVAILPTLTSDFYIALGEAAQTPRGTAFTIRFYRHPFVRLIFWGAALMALGGALAIVALALRRRREAMGAGFFAAPAPAAAPAE